MKTRPTSPLTPAQREALEARFALRVSARLNEGAAALPHDITERLRVAREQAVRAASPKPVLVQQPASAPVLSPALSPVGVSAGGPSLIRMPGAHGVGRDQGRSANESPLTWGWKLASALPVLALLAGLWGIQAYFRAEKVQAATDVDMALLTDDLPPSAYADAGFAEFLRADANDSPVRPLETEVTEPDGNLLSAETAPAAATP
ncbi:MAG: hypothetical protein RI920_2021 [Pseudomonadota bacterium]